MNDAEERLLEATFQLENSERFSVEFLNGFTQIILNKLNHLQITPYYGMMKKIFI